jgi:hypothetical protein
LSNALPSAPGLAHFDDRTSELPSALRGLIAAHERVADMYGEELPRVRIAVGNTLVFDSSSPPAEVSRKQRCVELARTLFRRPLRR